MKFLILFFAMCNVSYGQFQTVELSTFETITTLETIEVSNLILGQVELDTVSYDMHMSSEKQKRILFRGDRGGRLRELLNRLFGRNNRGMG